MSFGDPVERSMRPLRALQAAAVSQVVQAIKEGHKHIILQAPCGFGKTLLAAHMIESARKKDNPALFACPAIALVNQTLAAFEAEGLSNIGVIQAQHERTDWLQPIQIASVQTLIRRSCPEAKLIFIDEAHFQFKAINAKLHGEWKDTIVIGPTATPWARGMGLHWSKLLVAATVQQLLDDGLLCPYRIYAPADEYEVDTSGVKMVTDKFGNREFASGAAERVVNTPRLRANAVESYLQHREALKYELCGQVLKGFIFAQNRAHAQALRDDFHAAGINCGYIDANCDTEDRRETFRRYRTGEDTLIASVGCLVTGIDEDVRCILDLCITNSKIKYMQGFGRLLRNASGKLLGYYFDHAGNSQRLGLPVDIHFSKLDTRKPGEKSNPSEEKPVPKPRKCKFCNCVMPSYAKVCPACGQAVKLVNTVEVEAGELVEYGSGKKSKRPAAATMPDMQAFYSGLLGLAQERGHSEGWAAHIYRDKFAVWPNPLQKIPAPPSEIVRNYEHSRRIAFIKSKRGQHREATQ